MIDDHLLGKSGSKGSILKELKEDIFIYFFDWIKNIFEDSRFPFFFYIWFLQ